MVNIPVFSRRIKPDRALFLLLRRLAQIRDLQRLFWVDFFDQDYAIPPGGTFTYDIYIGTRILKWLYVEVRPEEAIASFDCRLIRRWERPQPAGLAIRDNYKEWSGVTFIDEMVNKPFVNFDLQPFIRVYLRNNDPALSSRFWIFLVGEPGEAP